MSSVETMRAQAMMAKQSGIEGFFFYYYSFGGHRLLERPLENFLGAPDLDINFALIWANESWSRRWDGHESEVLISQRYEELDEHGLVSDFARHFRDPRYLRLNDRALLIVYRPGHIPHAKAVFERWRYLFRQQHGENPILAMAQGFGDVDPRIYGLDAAVEFPPHKVTANLRGIEDQLETLDYAFSARVFAYESVVAASLSEPSPPFPIIRTAVPSWDNDARQQGRGMVIAGSTPLSYQRWLQALIRRSVENKFFGQAIVCINAWNEWAEAAYLEPDQYFGAAYLNATARAVSGTPKDHRFKILLVSHDAHAHGAQYIILHIGSALRELFGVELEFLCLGDGALLNQFESIADTTVTRHEDDLTKYFEAKSAAFCHALVNSAASSHVTPYLKNNHISFSLLVHELPQLLEDHELGDILKFAISAARDVIFPADYVGHKVLSALNLSPAMVTPRVLPQGLYKPMRFNSEGRAALRERLEISPLDKMVICVGYADFRKGFDLFLQMWKVFQNEIIPDSRTHYVWIGRLDPGLSACFRREIKLALESGTFHLVGFTEQIEDYLSAADVFVLTSREDPFPSVVLEALSVGLPIIAFADTGGIPEFLTRHRVGAVVPFCDVFQMADAVRGFLRKSPNPREFRRHTRQVIEDNFDWSVYVRKLLHLAVPDLPSVSVAILSFNYSRYIRARLISVLHQSMPIKEVVVIDDASTDDSVDVLRAAIRNSKRKVELLINEANSGSVFRQWARAAEYLSGDYIWIAESDDHADPLLLEHLTRHFEDDPAVVLAFCDSVPIDEDDQILGANYKDYYSTVEPGALAENAKYSGPEFCCRFLSVKNIILNVSAVLWRREALLDVLQVCREELANFRMAGDWRLYIELMSRADAKVAYEASPLNMHRRHAKSVTHALYKEQHLDEVARIHSIVRKRFQLTPEVTAAQDRYLRHLADQLGLK